MHVTLIGDVRKELVSSEQGNFSTSAPGNLRMAERSRDSERAVDAPVPSTTVHTNDGKKSINKSLQISPSTTNSLLSGHGAVHYEQFVSWATWYPSFSNTEMRETILLQNVQGLKDPTKVDIVRNYYNPLILGIDFLCFQEHKLSGQKIVVLHHQMWAGVGFYGNEAVIAYRSKNNVVDAGSEGVCTWVAPRLHLLVKSSYYSQFGRAQWLILRRTKGGDIAIFNVYASHTSTKRCELWHELIAKFPQDLRWVMVGNRNFIKRRSDKANANSMMIPENKQRVFLALIVAIEVDDPFWIANIIKFSWDSRRRRPMARLDRMYAWVVPRRPTTCSKYRICGDYAYSDRYPVWKQIELQTGERWASIYEMNVTYLQTVKVQGKIRQLWASHPNLAFFSNLRRCIRFYKQYCVRKQLLNE